MFRTFVSALEAAGPWTNTIVSELNHLYTSLSTTMSMPQTASLHVDRTIQTQASQIPTSTDHESDSQARKDLYEVISQAESTVSDIEFSKREGTLVRETKHIRRQFAGLICKVIASIKEAQVEVKTLVTFLQQVELYHRRLCERRLTQLNYHSPPMQHHLHARQPAYDPTPTSLLVNSHLHYLVGPPLN